ncbi:MAG: glycosyltransferase, partial [Acidimicrobiia bacterium]
MRNVLVLLSSAGGGDRPPVIALGVGLAQRGHRVTFVCDAATQELVASTGIDTIRNDVPQVGYISSWAKSRLDGESPQNPFTLWAEQAAPSVLDQVRSVGADAIVSSLFCMGLAKLISEELSVPWCFVNPSFYFGDLQASEWEDDWYGPVVPLLAQECFVPLVDDASLVLHATDPLFDPLPRDLPENHHMVGFLLWEPAGAVPDVLSSAGDPWVMVTASTSRPADEEAMLRSTVAALEERDVRIVMTLPQDNWKDPVPPNMTITGFAPHTPILERSALCVSQAGHGIVSKCLTNGVPMILIPWDADQPGVANRAASLGVAAVVDRDDTSHETVFAAVDQILG